MSKEQIKMSGEQIKEGTMQIAKKREKIAMSKEQIKNSKEQGANKERELNKEQIANKNEQRTTKEGVSVCYSSAACRSLSAYSHLLFSNCSFLFTHRYLLIAICYLLFVICSCPNPLVLQILEPKTVTFETNGGSQIESQPVYKGYPIMRPSNPSRSGYVFDAWYIDNYLFRMQWDFTVIPTTDITLFANWRVDDTGIIEMDGQPLSTKTVTIRNGRSVTFSAAAGLTDYNIWTLNGAEVSRGPSYTFDTSDNNKEPGKDYIIGLIVRKDDEYYSAQITVRIEE
jgi:uncharacterized repeat protein (TIGR02543 family)